MLTSYTGESGRSYHLYLVFFPVYCLAPFRTLSILNRLVLEDEIKNKRRQESGMVCKGSVIEVSEGKRFIPIPRSSLNLMSERLGWKHAVILLSIDEEDIDGE